MKRSLPNLLNIRPDERPRVLILYSMAFLFFAGITWAQMTIEPSFYFHVGTDSLGLVFAANAFISIIITAVYTGFVDRASNTVLLMLILLFSAAAIGCGLYLIQVDQRTAYLLLYVLVRVVRSAFLLHWWTHVNSYYDTRAAKRIAPVMSSASRLAIIFAALTLPTLNSLVSGSALGIIAVWIGLLILVLLIAWLMPILIRLLKATDQEPVAAEPLSTLTSVDREKFSYFSNVREGFRYVARSPYLRWRVVSTVVMVLIFALLNNQGGEIFRLHFDTREDLSDFYAYLTAATSLIMFPIEAFLFSRIIGSIGLGNASLIFPVGTLAISGLLIGFPTSSVAASLAYYDRMAFRYAIREPSNNLLYNAVPLRIKGRARAFINGLVIPIGLLLSTGMLELLKVVPDGWVWALPALLAGLAVSYVVSAIVIRRKYSEALINMLEQEDFSFLLSSGSDLAIADSSTLGWLTRKLDESEDTDFKIFMANLISEVGGNEAVPILGKVARAGDARVRSTIIDILVAAGMRGDAVRQLYTDFLDDPNEQVRRSSIAGLEHWAGSESEEFLERALEMLPDPSLDVRAQVIPPLIKSGDFFYLASAVQALSTLVSDDDPHRRALGVHVLGQAGDVRFIRNLVQYLADPQDQVRLEAATAIEALSRTRIPERIARILIDHLDPLVEDPVERVRSATITILEKVDSPEAHQIIVRFLGDASPQVRQTAVDTLCRIGDPVIPILSPVVDDETNPQMRRMAIAALSRIDRDPFGPKTEALIEDNLHTIYDNFGRLQALSSTAHHPSIAILQSMLREHNQDLLDEIFDLLKAIHDPEAVEIVAESLESDAARVRANAVEALESLTTPRTAGLMAPLFDISLGSEDLSRIGQTTWETEMPDTADVIRQFITATDDPWLRAVMTFAIGEIGAELATRQGLAPAPGPSKPASPLDRIAGALAEEEERPTRRPRPADLLAKLTDDEPEPAAPPSEEPASPVPSDAAGRPVFTLAVIESMLEVSLADSVVDVRIAAHTAKRMIAGLQVTSATQKEEAVLSTIERVIFLKEVSFFQSMTVDQLKVLAAICEEELFEGEQEIFEEGDPGGALYVVVSGRVAIERAAQRKGSVVRLATIEPRSYFGEMSLFDESPRSTAARAIQDTLTLRLRREPVVVLSRQYPDLSLELINILSQRLREANDRIAELTRSRPRELDKLYDKLG